jgi:hypothetical protein
LGSFPSQKGVQETMSNQSCVKTCWVDCTGKPLQILRFISDPRWAYSWCWCISCSWQCYPFSHLCTHHSRTWALFCPFAPSNMSSHDNPFSFFTSSQSSLSW